MEMIGKEVIVFHQCKYKYEGILLDVTATMIVLKDIKEGTIALPISECKMRLKDG